MEYQGNFLQTQQHCLTCHADYFGSHQCSIQTNTPINAENCHTCIQDKRIKEMIYQQTGKNYKFCPHCGKEL